MTRLTAWRAAIATLVWLAASAHAAVHVCIEDGAKVFRDRPCADADAAQVPAPIAPRAAKEWPDLPASTTTIPIFSQVLVFTMPARYKPGFQRNTPIAYMAEFLPRDQAMESWRELLTVQGFKDGVLRPEMLPAAMLAALAERNRRFCPAHLIFQPLGDLAIDSYPAHAAIIGCARMQVAGYGAKVGQGEVSYYVAIRGARDIYVVHRAIRGAAFAAALAPITPANAAALLRELQPLKLCGPTEKRDDCLRRAPR